MSRKLKQEERLSEILEIILVILLFLTLLVKCLQILN
jgi:hypothetical protein